MPETPKKKAGFNVQHFLRARRYLAISIGISLVCIVIFFSAIFPRVQGIQTKRQTVQKEQKKLESNQQKLQILENVESIDVYAQKDRINALLPSEKPLLPLLRRLETLSGESNVIVTEFGLSPGQISSGSAQAKQSSKNENVVKNTQSVETKLTVLGKIGDINAFLRALNTVSPITSVSALSLKKINTRSNEQVADNTPVFEVTLTLQTFYFLGKVESKASQQLPSIDEIGEEVIAKIQSYTIPTVSQQVPIGPVIGGGKQDLFE